MYHQMKTVASKESAKTEVEEIKVLVALFVY